MKKFLKNLWKALLEGPDMEPIVDDDGDYVFTERPKHESWCPHCEWSGSSIEFVVHLQNYHKA